MTMIVMISINIANYRGVDGFGLRLYEQTGSEMSFEGLYSVKC